MATGSRPRGRAAPLTGRHAELSLLDELAEAVRAGESRVLVLHGEPGVGKTALLDHLAARASGCQVARATWVQSEMELAFAGLHQLCAPMLGHLEAIPAPQRDAARIAFGLSAGPAPDRFLHQRLPRSRLDIIDAGHFTWEDAVAEYSALITSWWRGDYAVTGSR
jgi:pimeloyl-ACP methyl ester carboxylesterase